MRKSWTEDELEARVDAIIETYRLPEVLQLRRQLLDLAQVYYTPRRPFREWLAAIWGTAWEWTTVLGPLFLVICAILAVLVAFSLGIARASQRFAKQDAYNRSVGLVYQTQDVLPTGDGTPVEVLVQTRLCGGELPTAGDWRGDEQARFQQEQLREYLRGRSLASLKESEAAAWLMRRFSEKPYALFDKRPAWFREGERWTVGVSVRFRAIGAE